MDYPVAASQAESPVALSLAALAAGLDGGPTLRADSRPLLSKVVNWLC